MLMTAIVSSALPAHMVSLLEEAHLLLSSLGHCHSSFERIGAIQVLRTFLVIFV
jgi:hypothetical protein